MINEILLLHHTHTDIGYTHAQPVVWELNRLFIDDALDEIERTADWDPDSRPIWTCEVTETLRYWLNQATPHDRERFRRAVVAGRMSACAMPYNLTPMIGVPQFLRALAPLTELRRSLGLPFNVALNHDVNGLPWTMIPLLLDAGVELVMMGINVHFGGFPLHRPLFFRWVGPDGRSIIALNGEHYGMFQRYARVHEGSLDAMAEGIAAYEQKLAAQHYPHDFAYLSLTHYSFWDNNPPYPAAFDLIRQWNAAGRTPRIRFVTPDELLARAKTMPLPEYRGDWTDYWNFGAASSAYETRLGHQARTMLYATDLLTLQQQPARDPAAAHVIGKAYAALNLWDEHTWGDHASIGDPDRESVRAGWYHKAHPAYEAHALARFALTEQLERLAANPRHAPKIAGVLMVNPTPVARSEYIRLPRDAERYDHLSSTLHRLAEPDDDSRAALRGTSDETRMYGPFELPAYGYTLLPFSELTLQEATGLTIAEGLLESPTHRLRFDPTSGAIHSLTDIRSGREFADPTSPWAMLSLIHETVDGPTDTPNIGRDALLSLDYGQFQETSFVADWPARRTAELPISVQTLREADRIGLEVRASLPDAPEIVKRIWLAAHHDRVTIDLSIRKTEQRAPDSIYLALPLNLPGWEAVYDTMGTPTILDTEQLPGVCRDWITVSGYVDVHTSAAGITLACPDAPLAVVGEFAFGKRRTVIERSGQPLLLGWLFNNYWNTNFCAAQPGLLRFHYELRTHQGFDPNHAAHTAACARSPFRVHPAVAVEQPTSGVLLSIQSAGVLLAACERTPQGAQLWLQNQTTTPDTAIIRLGRGPIHRAVRCDSLGQPGEALAVTDGSVAIQVPARGIIGIAVDTTG